MSVRKNLKLGQEIEYDLLGSSSSIDRRMGHELKERGAPHTRGGIIQGIEDWDVLVSGRSYLGTKRISKEYIL